MSYESNPNRTENTGVYVRRIINSTNVNYKFTTMKEHIKALFEQVNRLDKNKVILEISHHVPVTPQTIQRNWLCDSAFWSVPERYQETVLKILQNWIAEQNKVKA
jgi:hypothetical protein